MTDLTAIKGNERKNKYMNERHTSDYRMTDLTAIKGNERKNKYMNERQQTNE